MKKGVVISGAILAGSALLLSKRCRQTAVQIVNGETFDKVYELKNVVTDWKKNQ